MVLILPMRNGNIGSLSKVFEKVTCSYPTYEEWKLDSAVRTTFVFSVLILPMRNGNF